MTPDVALFGGIPRKTFLFRLWAVVFCVIAFMYAWLAEGLAGGFASGLSSGPWFELVYRSTLLILLLVGYWAMGYVFQRQRTPLKSMGLIRRKSATGEFGTGAAFGWGAMVVCVLPMAVIGGFTITFWTGPRQFGLLVLDLVVLLVAALAEEVIFRGYPFQRLIDGVGPVLATLIVSAVFAIRHLGNPDSSLASTLVTVLAGWLFRDRLSAHSCALAALGTAFCVEREHGDFVWAADFGAADIFSSDLDQSARAAVADR